MNYYVNDYDQKYYVHVVVYEDIRQAAFQMHYINSSEIFNAKILRVINKDRISYAVVIAAFKGNQVKEMCDVVDEWENSCISNVIDIGCYYNG